MIGVDSWGGTIRRQEMKEAQRRFARRPRQGETSDASFLLNEATEYETSKGGIEQSVAYRLFWV
jgi:hypothetical protein